jgi:hypothetical protein
VAVWVCLCPEVLEISFVAHQLYCFGGGFSCVGLLRIYFFASLPFSGASSVICQPAPCYKRVVMVCWFFFNFAMLFYFECCSLAQEMSFVGHYLTYFRQPLITRPLSALLPFQHLSTESACGNQLLAPPPFSFVLTTPHPLCCVLVFSSLFIV